MSPVQPEIQENRRLASVAELASRRGGEQAWSRFAQAQSHEEFCSSWLAIQCDSIGRVSDGVVLPLEVPANEPRLGDAHRSDGETLGYRVRGLSL